MQEKKTQIKSTKRYCWKRWIVPIPAKFGNGNSLQTENEMKKPHFDPTDKGTFVTAE